MLPGKLIIVSKLLINNNIIKIMFAIIKNPSIDTPNYTNII